MFRKQGLTLIGISLLSSFFILNLDQLEASPFAANETKATNLSNKQKDVCIQYDNITRTIVICNGSVNIPTIYSFLNNSNNILINTGYKEWTLQANILILENATLAIKGSDSFVLKINSNYSDNKAYSITSRGNLIIDNTKIIAWNSTSNAAPDFSALDIPRGYILTFWNSAGKTNITNSHLENLGYKSYEGTQGITFLSGHGSLIQNNTLIGNYIGVRITNNVSNIMVSNNDISKSYLDGVNLESQTNKIRVWNNTIHENNLHAISCKKKCNDANIKYNVLKGNIGIGIFIDKQSKNAIIEGNKIEANTMGTMLSETSDNKVISNSFEKNGNGIFLKKTKDNSVIENNLTDSNNYGINVYQNSSQNLIQGNNIKKTMNVGINIANYGTKYNKIIDNNITDGLNIGVRFDKTADNILEDNNIRKNKINDFYIKLSKGNKIIDSFFNNSKFFLADKKSSVIILDTNNILVDGNNITNTIYPTNNTITLNPLINSTRLNTVAMQVIPNSDHVNISGINNDFMKNTNYKRFDILFPKPEMQTSFMIGGFDTGSQILLKTNKIIYDLLTIDKRQETEFTFKNDQSSYRFEFEETKTPILITIAVFSILIGISVVVFFLLRKRRNRRVHLKQ